MNKPIMLMLCGVPGCGKSTYADKEKESFIIHSSDSIRAELGDVNDQSRDVEVFEILHNRIKEDLLAGHDVIYDATNVKKVYRKRFLESISDIQCYKDIVVFLTDLDECLARNEQRERQVPENVIKGMRMNFEYPTKDEGWDKIIFNSERRYNENFLYQ